MQKDEDILYKTIGVMFVQNVKLQKEQVNFEERITEAKHIIEFAAKLSNFVEDIANCQMDDLAEIQSKAYDLMKEEESYHANILRKTMQTLSYSTSRN